jgi:Flp pilus assembly protein TadG
MMFRRQRRAGAILLESAVIYPVLLLLVFAIIILGVGVFRYHQVAHAAREGARWAAVHGAKYAEETGRPAATPADVYANAIAPHAAGMQPPNLTYAVTWNQNNKQTYTVLQNDPVTGQPTLVTRANTVSVTVSYSWNTVLFGVIPVSSTSVMTMSY